MTPISVADISAVPSLPHPPNPPRQSPGDDDFIDIRPLIVAMRRHWLAIAIAALALASVGAGMRLTGPQAYTATTVVAISVSKLNTTAPQGAPLTTSAYRPLIESQNLASRVLRDFKLDPQQYSATTFFGGVVTIDEVRNSTVFLLHATMNDPLLAAQVANRTAAFAVDESRRLTQEESLRVRDDLQKQVDEAEARMRDADAKLVQFRDTSQIELLRRDVDASLQQRGGLLALLVQIETQKARLASAEQELAIRQPINTVKKTIDNDPALLEAARTSQRGPADLLKLQMQDESVNDVYQRLDSQVAESKATLAALERQRDQLIDVRKLDAPQFGQLTRLYNAETQLTRLQTDADLMRKVYEQVATAYQTARLQLAGRSAELQVVEAAIPPDRAISRHVLRYAVLGFVIGLLLAMSGAVLYESLREPRYSPAL